MNNVDIDSESTQVELEPKRVMIGDTDNGKKLLQMIHDLKALLEAYRQASSSNAVRTRRAVPKGGPPGFKLQF